VKKRNRIEKREDLVSRKRRRKEKEVDFIRD